MLPQLVYLQDLCSFNILWSRTKTELSIEEAKDFQRLAEWGNRVNNPEHCNKLSYFVALKSVEKNVPRIKMPAIPRASSMAGLFYRCFNGHIFASSNQLKPNKCKYC